MDQNNKNKKNGNKNSGSWRGVVQLVCWALVLTAVISYASSYMTSAGHSSSSVELEYSDFLDMVESGQVSSVDFDTDESILHIIPADGYRYETDSGVTYLKRTDENGDPYYSATTAEGSRLSDARLDFFTVQIESNDTVTAFLTEHGVHVNKDYQPPTSFITLLLINLLPFVIIILVFSLFMNWMAKKGGMGGIGGIGGVGKANAKVYMEKQTGVTFAAVSYTHLTLPTKA